MHLADIAFEIVALPGECGIVVEHKSRHTSKVVPYVDEVTIVDGAKLGD